ncbi:MAG: CDP-archaeol synthase [Alphaproteobacteria bacterium]|nr:CDP-archaeol synthase [Alphaproteobacteria bacterium]
MQLLMIGRALVLLFVANGVPVALNSILGRDFSRSIDGGHRFFDGRPLLGTSKTLRGLLASLVATAICAPFLGISWITGALFALLAMAGDLFSSFLKRRLGLAPSSKAIGLDQIPESVVPLIVFDAQLGLSMLDIVVCVVAFVALELSFSPIFYWLGLKNRPY